MNTSEMLKHLLTAVRGERPLTREGYRKAWPITPPEELDAMLSRLP